MHQLQILKRYHPVAAYLYASAPKPKYAVKTPGEDSHAEASILPDGREPVVGWTADPIVESHTRDP